MNDHAEAALARARSLWERGGRLTDAFGPLRRAYELDRSHPQLQSWYGLYLGILERRYGEALELCLDATKRGFDDPALYLNVARLHLAFDFKAEALRYLRRGEMVDAADAEIRRALARLGRRERPVIRFLPRRHVLNRILGSARHRLTGHRSSTPREPSAFAG